MVPPCGHRVSGNNNLRLLLGVPSPPIEKECLSPSPPMDKECLLSSYGYILGFIFEATDRSRSLSLAQINNLGSDLSLASIVTIARCLQVFVLTSTFLSIRFTRKV